MNIEYEEEKEKRIMLSPTVCSELYIVVSKDKAISHVSIYGRKI